MKPGPDQPDFDFTSGNVDGLVRWRAEVQSAEKTQVLELNFASGSDQLTSWRREQAEKMLAIARKEGLPIGESVRVVLQSDVELTGRLLLDWENKRLQIDRVTFQKSEIVSCVRS